MNESRNQYRVPDPLAPAMGLEKTRQIGEAAPFGDEGARVELTGGDSPERGAGVVGAVMEGAHERDLGIVKSRGVERDSGARHASAEEKHLAARRDQVGKPLPDLGAAGTVNGEVRRELVRRPSRD